MSGRALQKLIGGRFIDWAIPSMLALFLMQALAYADSPSSEALSNDGIKRALLIGINKYLAVPKLQGSLNDVETMKRVLTTRWGFLDRHIVTLTDEAATRKGIIAALEQMVKEAGPKDTVYVHYSGHGSQVVDLNGDEQEDGLDETLVPQDGRTTNVRDITDDELNEMFSQLKARHALVVLDSCHSGTATRSLEIRTRSIPSDFRQELYEQYERSKIMTRGAVVPTLSSRYVLMTGAAAHQEALDGPVDGRYHGFFTYALSRTLGSLSAEASPRDVFSGVEREFRRLQTQIGRSSMPEPQLETPPSLLDSPLFGASTVHEGQAVPRLVWAEVRPGGPAQVVLAGGVSLGASVGSTWSVYPPGETKFRPGQALAVATVSRVSDVDAMATIVPSNAIIVDRSRAVQLLPASNGPRLPVRIIDGAKETGKDIEEALRQAVPGIEFVDNTKSPKFLVDVQGSVVRLLSAEGLQLVATFGKDQNWGAAMALIMSRSVNASEILTLENPSSRLKVDLRIVNRLTAKSAVNQRGVAVLAGNTSPSSFRIRRDKEHRTSQNSLQLEVQTDADAYVTVANVDSEGGVRLLFPNEYQRSGFYPDGFLRRSELMRLPDSLDSNNRAGFHWDYGPPAGIDTIRVFAATDLETATKIRHRIQEIQHGSPKLDKVVSRGGMADLGSLRGDLASTAVQGSAYTQERSSLESPDERHTRSHAFTPRGTTDSAVMPPRRGIFLEQDMGPGSYDWAAASVTVEVND